MSELLNEKEQRGNFRRNLLVNVSMVALLGYLGVSSEVQAASDDADKPILWIELGGQFERADSAQTIFAPSFVDVAKPADRLPMIDAQRPSPFSSGGEGKITFLPEATNWVLSASIRYGRSSAARHQHQQTSLPSLTEYIKGRVPLTRARPKFAPFGDGQSDLGETHVVADFQAGRDVGLGMFGSNAHSVVSAGVRFAQFTSNTDLTLHARPIATFFPFSKPGKYNFFDYTRHENTAVLQAKHDTHAIGPTLSWDASVPIAGNGTDMAVALDWGANGAILFGRQRARIHHQTTGHAENQTGNFAVGLSRHSSQYEHGPYDYDRSRAVMIPNVGAFAGASLKFLNAKVSLGYRADFFFGAMDSGIDTAKKTNVGFYGPFASISVGLGG